MAVAVSATTGTPGKGAAHWRGCDTRDEVVAPFGDAMRLIDRDELDVHIADERLEFGSSKSLRRDIEEPGSVRARRAQSRRAVLAV